MKKSIQIVCSIAFVVMVRTIQAQTFYDNGPINTSSEGYDFASSDAIANSFILSSQSTLTGVTIGIDLFTSGQFVGDQLGRVTWSFTTAAFGGTTLATGTATSFSSVPVSSPPSNFSYYEDSFSIPQVTIPAGNYWFELSSGLTADDYIPFWSISNGTSLAERNNGVGVVPSSNSFQLTGSEVPEPSTLAFLSITLAGGFIANRRK